MEVVREPEEIQMSYYDHATALAFKLGKWSEPKPLRNFELEALARAQDLSAPPVNKPPLLERYRSIFRPQKPPHSQ